MDTLKEKLRILQDGRPNSFSLTLNEYWTTYTSIEEAVGSISLAEFASSEERAKCLETGEIWVLMFYYSTQVGYVEFYASNPESAVDAAIKFARSHNYISQPIKPQESPKPNFMGMGPLDDEPGAVRFSDS